MMAMIILEFIIVLIVAFCLFSVNFIYSSAYLLNAKVQSKGKCNQTLDEWGFGGR